jgi:hypothetical protein
MDRYLYPPYSYQPSVSQIPTVYPTQSTSNVQAYAPQRGITQQHFNNLYHHGTSMNGYILPSLPQDIPLDPFYQLFGPVMPIYALQFDPYVSKIFQFSVLPPIYEIAVNPNRKTM